MAAGFTVQIAGLPDLQRRYAAAGAIIEDELTIAMGRVVLATEAEMKAESPVASGALRQSIGSEVKPIAGGVRGAAGPGVQRGLAGTMKTYAQYVIGGRRPGKMPPILPIMDWVKVKTRYSDIFQIDVNDEAQVRRVAYAVARGIARRGVAPNDFMQRAVDTIRPAAEREFRAVPKKAAARITGGGR